MIVAMLAVTLRGLLFTITGSCFVAEFSGYWLHRLLHSDAFPALSRGHLIHRTISKCHRPFNCSGYRIARLRYNLNRDRQEDWASFPAGFRAWDASRALKTAAIAPRFPEKGGNPLSPPSSEGGVFSVM